MQSGPRQKTEAALHSVLNSVTRGKRGRFDRYLRPNFWARGRHCIIATTQVCTGETLGMVQTTHYPDAGGVLHHEDLINCAPYVMCLEPRVMLVWCEIEWCGRTHGQAAGVV